MKTPNQTPFSNYFKYEQEKRKIPTGLTPEEYETVVRELAEKYKI